MYLDTAVVPNASFPTSIIHQRLVDLRFRYLLDVKKFLVGIFKLNQSIMYIFPKSVATVTLTTISDATHGGCDSIYGKTGYLPD